jgi:hypothetical protein
VIRTSTARATDTRRAFRLAKVAVLLALGVAAAARSASLAPPRAPTPPRPAQTINECSILGGINYGNQNLTCTERPTDLVVVRPRPGERNDPIRTANGSYLRQIIYRVPEPIDVTFNMCSPDLLDVFGASLDGGMVATRRLPSTRRDCIATRFLNLSGIFALSVRTRRPESNVEFEVSAFLPPPPPPMVPPPIMPPPMPPPR